MIKKQKKKNWILNLGFFSIIIAPIFTIIACGKKDIKDIENIEAINAKIKAEFHKKTLPKILSGSETKTSTEVFESDFEITPSDSALTSTIKKVKPLSTNSNDDGTTVTVTIEVASIVRGTIHKVYLVDLKDFTSRIDRIAILNKQIQQEANKKTMPIVVHRNFRQKAAIEVYKQNIKIVPYNLVLQSKIKEVVPSTKTPDGTTVSVTIEVNSYVSGTNPKEYTVELKGFMPAVKRYKEVNYLIQQEFNMKTPAEILGIAKHKTADDVETSDLQFIAYDSTVIGTVTKVVPSTKTPDGTTVTVTIEVYSYVSGTISKEYTVEIVGFTKKTKL